MELFIKHLEGANDLTIFEALLKTDFKYTDENSILENVNPDEVIF